MQAGKTVFAQLMDFIPPHEFRRCVNRYGGSAPWARDCITRVSTATSRAARSPTPTKRATIGFTPTWGKF